MSMLADKKQKQRWSLNPRGKDWSEDTNKFGFKMLEKMGWSKGKGLGAKENGLTEHVKVSYKNDIKGLGFKENEEQWTEHEDKFSALLKNLTSNVEIIENKNLKSLEQKSQNSKVRVHYYKFTRGKDLSRYSKKDLASIFGKKNWNHPEEINGKTENVEIDNNRFEVSKKCKKRKRDKCLAIDNPAFNGNDSNCDENDLNSIKNDFNVASITENGSESNKKRKKQKKFASMEIDNPAFVLNDSNISEGNSAIIDETSEKSEIKFESIIESDSKSNKKNRKQKKFALLEIDNPAFVLNDSNFSEGNSAMIGENSNSEKSEVKCESITENDSKSNKKSKKRKKIASLEIDNPSFVLNDSNSENCEVLKSNISEFNSEIIDEVSEKSEIKSDSIIENGSKSNNKIKKQKKIALLEIDNPAFVLNDSNFSEGSSAMIGENSNSEKSGVKSESITENDSKSNKKSKKRKKIASLEIDNPAFDFDSNSENSIKNEVKKKRKINQIDSKSQNFEIKRNKMERKIENNQIETKIINKNIKTESRDNTNLESTINCDLMLNITTTPILKNSTIEVCSEKKRKNVRFSGITQQRIIPNIHDSPTQIENAIIEDNVTSMAKKLDDCQAEIENDLNEAKDDQISIGTVSSEICNMKVEEGTILRYRNAGKINKTLKWVRKNEGSISRKSYKHLIKGDITVLFKNANLHEIDGYAVKKN